jgi:hypothetical protein
MAFYREMIHNWSSKGKTAKQQRHSAFIQLYTTVKEKSNIEYMVAGSPR